MGKTSSWMRRPALRILVFGVIAFGGMLVILLRPSAHDPDWWKHVGLKKQGPKGSTVVFSDDGTVLQSGAKISPQDVGHHEDGVNIIGPNHLLQSAEAGNAKNQKPVMRPLVNGREYFSDYDVSSVKLTEDPLDPLHPPYFNYIDPETSSEYAMQYLSNRPRVLAIQDFLSHEECDAIVKMAKTKLMRSQVAPMVDSKDKNPVQDVRTSSQAWLSPDEEPIRTVVERLLRLTGFPKGSNELLQVLKYEVGQHYDAHNDYFDPRMYGQQSSNRAVTVFLYLNDVEEGGETQFPRADGKPPTYDFKSCNRGLRVRPRKGQVALFYDMKPNGELDPTSLHGGCDVIKGVKWGGTLWLRIPTGGAPSPNP